MNKTLQGTILLPGDKSISHRALMFLGISQGSADIQNLSSGQDVLSTLSCMQSLGCTITPQGENAYHIRGLSKLQQPDTILDCGNSGTTIRLLSGLLAGTGMSVTLTGDASLLKRPMSRITDPLKQMGARVDTTGEKGCAPIRIAPPESALHGIQYKMPMASAQVKSAILLAGLFTDPSEAVIVQEPYPSRDHTERMLDALGARVLNQDGIIRLTGRQQDLLAQPVIVPGDISSAAFWMVGAAILPGSDITIQQVGLNPLRTGILDVFAQIGFAVPQENVSQSIGEPLGDLRITSQPLKGDITITPAMVPALIDEIPILTILGLFTDGTFTLHGAEELRYKESDRLESMIHLLKRLGIDVEIYDDGFAFQGNAQWKVPSLEEPFATHHDHRLVMALEILNLRAETPLKVEGKEWASISYPGFFTTLERLIKPNQ